MVTTLRLLNKDPAESSSPSSPSFSSPLPPPQLAICCRQLQSKDQALKILKQELDLSREQVEQCRQEIAQLVREGGREEGRKGGREGGREGGRKGGREGGREGGRKGGKEGGREGGREEILAISYEERAEGERKQVTCQHVVWSCRYYILSFSKRGS